MYSTKNVITKKDIVFKNKIILLLSFYGDGSTPFTQRSAAISVNGDGSTPFTQRSAAISDISELSVDLHRAHW